MQLRTITVALALLVEIPAAAAGSEDPPPFVTDRPDVTESATVLGRGFFQFEAGYAFARLDLDGERVETAAFPATLVRAGLDDKVELRLEWAGYVNVSSEVNGVTTDDSGSGNTVLGAKLALREGRGLAPQLALLVDAVLPTGEKGFRTERIDPRVRLAGAHSISDRIGLGWNVGVVALSIEDDGGEQHTHGVGRYSLSAAFGFGERWGAFAEVFGFVPLSGPDSTKNLFDAGFTFLVSDTVQLDMSGGIGLSEAADDWFVGAGISFRLPR
jgi:hypothetical protein